MKSTILIFFLTLLASQLTEATTATAVLDVSGDKVLPGVDYYIVPAILGAEGGGLALARKGDCLLTVEQKCSDLLNGDPVKFYPVDPEAKVVTLNTDTNVNFTLRKEIPVPLICPPGMLSTTVWKVQADEGTGKLYVGVGGEIGNPGPGTLANWFKIEETWPGAYKFVFRPDVDVGSEIISGDLGILFENGGRWLGLAEYPFTFVIMKA